jgi:hypothetical protein
VKVKDEKQNAREFDWTEDANGNLIDPRAVKWETEMEAKMGKLLRKGSGHGV